MTSMPQSGLAFHVHHNKLVEWCIDYQERVDYIKANKPAEELETRLKLFQLIPAEMVPVALGKAWAALGKAEATLDKAEATLDKARAAYDEAWAALGKAWAALDKAEATLDEAWAALGKAWAALGKAEATLDKARAAYDEAWAARNKARDEAMPELEKLHTQLCPNCPWDGGTIFPGREN